MKFKLKKQEGFNIVKDNNTIDAYEKLLRLDTAVGIEETTYNDLVTKKNNGELIPGKHYRIIDYETTTALENTQSAGHQFDIVVLALDKQTLSEDAKAILHEGDTYFSGNDVDLSSWEIKYTTENDDNKYEWALPRKRFLYIGEYSDYIYEDPEDPTSEIIGVDTTSYTGLSNTRFGYYVTGSISEEDDTIYQVFVSEDFTKMILMPLDTVDTFDDTNGSTPGSNPIIPSMVGSLDSQELNVYQYPIVKIVYDGGKGVIYNMKDDRNNECPYDFKNIQFLRKLTGVEFDSDNGEDTYVYTFTWADDGGETVQIIDGSCLPLYNDFKFYVNNNKIEPYVKSEVSSSLYKFQLMDNVFLSNGLSSYPENSITVNYICGAYEGNTFLYDTSHNTFKGICKSCVFNTVAENSFLPTAEIREVVTGGYFVRNIIAGSFLGVSTGNSCTNNYFSGFSGTLGEYCSYNKLINSSQVTLADQCSYNTITNSRVITLGKEFTRYVEIEGCTGITLTAPQTITYGNYIQNIKIMPGTNYDENNVKTITHTTANDTGLTIYKGNNITEVTV